jgi:hypothetical protein|tara:strand:+ start:91 stop:453 length:363 start_codon:yes stop_codon:yes gene_type:complete
MKIIDVDDLEIEFEKQHPGVSCKWCIYLRVRKKDHDKLLLMIKTNDKPKTRFTVNNGNTVTLMDKKQKADLIETLKDVTALDTSIQDEKSNPMENMFHGSVDDIKKGEKIEVISRGGWKR